MKHLMNFVNNIYTHKKHICFFTFAMILVIISLSPMLRSGYISDDASNSLVKGSLIEKNQTQQDLIFKSNDAWINSGRFFPLSMYVLILFSIIDNLFLYKLSILILVIVNIIIFGYFIRIITGSWWMTILSILLPAMFFQFRLYHDPILSFCLLQQLILLYTMLSIISLKYYLQNGKKYFLISSCFFYLLSLLTYEISYVFFILHFLIIYFYSSNRNIFKIINSTLPFIILSILCILISISLRFYYGVKYIGILPNYDMEIYIITLLKQTYAAFPLSYYSVDPNNIFQSSFYYLASYFSLDYIIIAIGFFVLFFLTLKNFNFKCLEKKCISVLLALGTSLLILPGVTISLSQKYQGDISWGIGYLPVYISYFGLVMIVIAILYMGYQKITNASLRTVLSIIIATILCTAIVINYNNNSIVVQHQNSIWLYPRTILEEALENGLLQSMHNDSYLLINSNNYWDKSAFFRLHSNTKLKIVGIKGRYSVDSLPKDALRSKLLDKYYFYDFSKNKNIYFLNYDSFSNENGYAILGKIKDLQVSKELLVEVNSQEIYLYIRTPYYPPLSSHEKIIIYGQWIKKNLSDSYESFSLDESQMRLVNSGLNWKLFSISLNPDTLIDLKSLMVNIIPRTIIPSTYWRPKNESEFSLEKNNGDLLHIGFKNGIIGNGVLLNPISLSTNFTMELMLKPSGMQISYAGVMGNHPGNKGFEGLVIQQDNQNQNVYTFGFGNGNEWLPGAKFKLNEDVWNYLVIVVEKNNIKVYNNSLLVASVDAKGTIKNSEMPLYIGNWIYGDRLFNGMIEEVRITNHTLSEKDILMNWQEIQEKLSKLD